MWKNLKNACQKAGIVLKKLTRKLKVQEDDISLKQQIKTQRIFFLILLIISTMYAIRFQNLYLEIWGYYQSSIDSDRQFLEQYHEITEMAQQISENNQKMFRLNQEMFESIQKILDIFGFVPEGMFLSPQEDQFEKN